MTISVDLGQQLESYVSDLVSKGRYGSKSEILREGVRLIQDREARLAKMNRAIEEGLAEADAGFTYDADEVFDRIEAKIQAMIDKK